MTREIDYGNLMHTAMRSLIKTVLQDVADNGLPGNHHFFITFDTNHPDAQLADWLSDRYPGEMTIVVQHWFDNLVIDDDGFAITLNFGDNPEPLYVPLDAIATFVDPSVEFGLRFESAEHDDEDLEDSIVTELEDIASRESEPKPTTEKKDADVVSLDSFRK
ncbi:SspB family protein [Epibacterium ulvae]|uniref:SspB family protein n=1 Tax=Epibacterium ulvae TaxID=1156985 RepID=UPI00249011F4|nr:ClpXP protease specificity-enhancing factor SspB [Epibacterium ulvae]